MTAAAASPSSAADRPGWLARVRVAVGGFVAAILGAAPHVLHHAGPLAGAALFAGVGGKLLFGALGLLLAIPMVRRLRRRTGSWTAPVAALALFGVVFLISTFVIGPALTGGDTDSPQGGTPTQQGPAPSGHEEHHR